MLSAKGNEDTHSFVQGFESCVLKSNGMASGHPFSTKCKPWVCLRIVPNSKVTLIPGEESEILPEAGSWGPAGQVWRTMTLKMGFCPY